MLVAASLRADSGTRSGDLQHAFHTAAEIMIARELGYQLRRLGGVMRQVRGMSRIGDRGAGKLAVQPPQTVDIVDVVPDREAVQLKSDLEGPSTA